MSNKGYRLEEIFINYLQECMTFNGVKIVNMVNYGKGLQKPDVSLILENGFRYDVSLKTSAGNHSGLVNNTPRNNFFKIIERHAGMEKDVKCFVSFLDKKFQEKGKNVRINLTKEEQEEHAKIFNFFLFKGTATRDSIPQANLLAKIGKEGKTAEVVRNPIKDLEFQLEFKSPRYQTDATKSIEWAGNICHIRIK